MILLIFIALLSIVQGPVWLPPGVPMAPITQSNSLLGGMPYGFHPPLAYPPGLIYDWEKKKMKKIPDGHPAKWFPPLLGGGGFIPPLAPGGLGYNAMPLPHNWMNTYQMTPSDFLHPPHLLTSIPPTEVLLPAEQPVIATSAIPSTTLLRHETTPVTLPTLPNNNSPGSKTVIVVS